MTEQKINTLRKNLVHLKNVVLCLVVGLGILPTAYSKPLVDRKPASNYAEDTIVIPLKREHWVNQVLQDDDNGTLVGIKQKMEAWDNEEEYYKNWHLELTGIYTPPTQKDKESLIKRDSLKYLDNRLAGEVRTAEKGSALAQAKVIEAAIRPNGKVEVSENVRIKFKAKVLQGKANVIVDNPYIDCNAEVKASGEVNLNVSKTIKDLGVKTGVEYQVTDGVWIASLSKQLSESVSTEISSHQSDSDMMFTDRSDRRIKLMYTKSF